jgi:hypothetical protein
MQTPSSSSNQVGFSSQICNLIDRVAHYLTFRCWTVQTGTAVTKLSEHV